MYTEHTTDYIIPFLDKKEKIVSHSERKLREHARPNYCDEEEIELPAKRSRHMGSECKIRKNTGAPASRKRNLGISSFTDPISVPNEDKGPQIMTEVVATNCKLSNRIVDLNNILLEKTLSR